MIPILRLTLSLILTGLLIGGYAVSQIRYADYRESGDPAGMIDYLAKLDASPVPWLSLLLVVGIVLLAFVPDQTDSEAT